MDYVFFLLLSACAGVGACAAVVHTWALRLRVYSLEDRLALMEGNLTREVKARAVMSHRSRLSKDEEAVVQALEVKPEPKAKKFNWWERLPSS